jgi:hypothetical protein
MSERPDSLKISTNLFIVLVIAERVEISGAVEKSGVPE